MLVSAGCSGSSAVTLMAHVLIQLHGLPTTITKEEKGYQWPKQELFQCEKNPACKNGNVAGAMRVVVAGLATKHRILVFEGDGSPELDAWETMRKMGTRAAVVWRSNMLGRVVCEIRDCFDGFGVDDKNPVGKRVGPNADACFSRRELPSEQQTKVYLNPKYLVDHMKTKEAHTYTTKLTQNGYDEKSFRTLATEVLLGYESADSELAFQQSIDAWKTLLRSLNVEPNQNIIAKKLAEKRGSRKPEDLTESIDNAGEIEKVLSKLRYPMNSFIRW